MYSLWMMRRMAWLAVAMLSAAACQPAPAAPSAAPASATLAAATPSPTLAPTPSPAPTPVAAECGQKVAASFILANDMKCPGDALVVVADGVVVDLGGHTLSGPGMGPQTWPAPQLDSVGVRVEKHTNIVVRSGKTTDFSTGVYLEGTTASVIEDVSSEHNRYGLYIHNSDGNTIRRSTVAVNIYGLHLQNSNDNLVQGNDLVRQTYNSPGGYGIYLYSSKRNRVIENNIENNINWGIWFSEASGNLVFHNNVDGNRPQVSDNTEGNTWHDAGTKEGNYWGDYPGSDGDGDHVGDSPYTILGPADVVDPYPFVEKDGWKKKTSATVDHYQVPAARPPRSVTLVALAGGNVVTAKPADRSATTAIVGADQIALGTNEHTLYSAKDQQVIVSDLATRQSGAAFHVDVDGIVAANRDGESVVVVGKTGAEQFNVREGQAEFFAYSSDPHGLAPSYKHNHIFVATPRGIDLLYLNLGGRTPYTIPLDGPAGAMAMNGSGTRIYTVAKGTGTIDIVDTEQYAVVERIPLGADATALAVSPSEAVLYAGTANGVVAIDIRTKAVRQRAQVLGAVADLAISPNGDEVYVALTGLEHGIAVLTAELGLINIVQLDADPVRVLAASY
ncbi:MAG: NosD domain-containing protein [Candidatus Limnocylindria bacterium]